MSHGGESFHKKVMWRISSKLFAVSGSTTPMASWDDFVGSTHFEVAIGIAIILNGIQMAFEIQHQGLKLGSSLNYGFYHNPDPWPGATYLFEGLGFFFGVIFTIEMTLKIMVLRLRFFCNAWNLFDMVVVAGWLVETLGETLQYTGESLGGYHRLPHRAPAATSSPGAAWGRAEQASPLSSPPLSASCEIILVGFSVWHTRSSLPPDRNTRGEQEEQSS
ncbi:unnamed protein product [Prorocentrum cordatum]|uniref:Ion transport domain-containing protein n=1 Tax=Prorocentrum cordatum TaxID=2364126 RepID=A0ABN9UMB3_9DINO|nr:unnamed protein product [Polarella glacialis]